MQAWAAFGLLGPSVTAAFPQFDKVGPGVGRDAGGTAQAGAPRRREGAAPHEIQTGPAPARPNLRPPAAADAAPGGHTHLQRRRG